MGCSRSSLRRGQGAINVDRTRGGRPSLPTEASATLTYPNAPVKHRTAYFPG